MRTLLSAAALLAALAGPAAAATCQTERLTCPTGMPLGGYCECTARGATEGGTVAQQATSRGRTNANTGGCGVNPSAPGCKG